MGSKPREIVAEHTNSQRERITIQRVGDGVFAGHILLVIHDDPPPRGTGIEAPTLLDDGTREWLLGQLATDRRVTP